MTDEEIDLQIRERLAGLVRERKLSKFSRWASFPLKTLTGIRLNQSKINGGTRKLTRHTRKELVALFAELDEVTQKEGCPL